MTFLNPQVACLSVFLLERRGSVGIRVSLQAHRGSAAFLVACSSPGCWEGFCAEVGCRYGSWRVWSICFLRWSAHLLAIPKSRILDTSNGIFTVGVGCEFPSHSLCSACFPRGCLGPCSAWAGHLSRECFLTPNVQEVLGRDVAEILCLHFLFLFLLTPLVQARVLPARAALAFLVLVHVWDFVLQERWERLVFDHQCLMPRALGMARHWCGCLVKDSGLQPG